MITGRTAQSIFGNFNEQLQEDGNLATPVPSAAERSQDGRKKKRSKAVRSNDPAPVREQLAPWHGVAQQPVVAPTPAQLGDVIVRVLSAKVVERTPADFDDWLWGPHLILKLQMSTTNPHRKTSYQTWAGQQMSFNRDYAILIDNHDNTYKMIAGHKTPNARTESDSIYPERPLTDVLIFEVPLKSADFLTLDLPASNVNEKGFFRFRIPTSMIEWQLRPMFRPPKMLN